MDVDEAVLAALEYGLPDCSGVALGLDRLLMLKMGTRDIADVLAFPLAVSYTHPTLPTIYSVYVSVAAVSLKKTHTMT